MQDHIEIGHAFRPISVMSVCVCVCFKACRTIELSLSCNERMTFSRHANGPTIAISNILIIIIIPLRRRRDARVNRSYARQQPEPPPVRVPAELCCCLSFKLLLEHSARASFQYGITYRLPFYACTLCAVVGARFHVRFEQFC